MKLEWRSFKQEGFIMTYILRTVKDYNTGSYVKIYEYSNGCCIYFRNCYTNGEKYYKVCDDIKEAKKSGSKLLKAMIRFNKQIT